MKLKRYLVYAYILRIFKIKVSQFSINVKVKYHSNIQKQNFTKKFTHNKQKCIWSITCFFMIYDLYYHLIALQVDIIAPL